MFVNKRRNFSGRDIAALFKSHDQDSNGYITPTEMKQFGRDAGLSWTEADVYVVLFIAYITNHQEQSLTFCFRASKLLKQQTSMEMVN